jgi:hypothetical protein
MADQDRSIYQTPRRILLMVAELHRRGFERLRIFPCEDQWMAWRCYFKAGIPGEPGSIVETPQHICIYMPQPFGWKDAAGDSIEQLADKFLERFPRFSAVCKVPDEEYATWFKQMLAATEPDGLIIELADRPLPTDRLITCNLPEKVWLPLPPPIRR